MIVSRRTRIATLVQNGIFAALLVAAALLLAQLAQQKHKEWDITQNARNSLSEGSIQTLALLDGPVNITAYVTKLDPSQGNLREGITEYLSRYQRVKPDIHLEFVDQREQPKRAAEANVRMNGEMVVEYGGRKENLTRLDEETLTNLLARLARNHERHVMFLDGHGERKPDGIANHDLGEFGKRLEAKGFRIGQLNLGVAQEVPDNTSVLVVAGPRVDVLPAEVEKIRRYLDKGGSLFWLIDQGSLHGLQPIADLLRLQLGPGVVVDPAANAFKASATLSIAFAYGSHPAVRNFGLNTAFPSARRIAVLENPAPWQFTPLVEVAQQGWVETGELDGDVSFDRGQDIPGPVVVAAALEREVSGRQQRVVVTGTGDFLANTHAGLLGNVDLGINLVNWLAGDENLITLQPRKLVDESLEMSQGSLTFIALAFLVGLPVAFLGTGLMIWWRRRRG